MKKLIEHSIKEFKTLASNHKNIAGITFFTIFFGLIFLISKREDTKSITYHNINQPDFSAGKVLSSGNDIYRRKDRIIKNKLSDLESKIKHLTEQLQIQNAKHKEFEEKNLSQSIVNNSQTQENLELKTKLESEPKDSLKRNPVNFSEPKRKLTAKRIDSVPTVQSYSVRKGSRKKKRYSKGPSIIYFPVKSKGGKTNLGVKLPSGSFVKAKLLTGVEAPEGKALPVLLQADYAFIGPNKSKVDLSGCFLIAKSTGNLSIERVEMQATKISCVGKSGRMFERNINGFVADNKDNSFAVMGEVNSKQDRVASMAFLSSIVEGIGGAIANAQTTTQTNGVGGSSMSISGDQRKYIAAQGASNAASVVTNWYLKHAQSLLPTINVGSGQDVWIIVQESVDLPNWFFKKSFAPRGEFSFLSKLTE